MAWGAWDASRVSEYSVLFAPDALVRRRMRARASYWILLAGATMAAISPLVTLASIPPELLQLELALLLLPFSVCVSVAVLAVKRLRGTSVWGERPLPTTALRMTAEGLWVGTPELTPTAFYPWSAIAGFGLSRDHRRWPHPPNVLDIDLHPGIQPDLRFRIGLSEADEWFHRQLGGRGPRLLLDTVAAPMEEITGAAQQFSASLVIAKMPTWSTRTTL